MERETIRGFVAEEESNVTRARKGVGAEGWPVMELTYMYVNSLVLLGSAVGSAVGGGDKVNIVETEQ